MRTQTALVFVILCFFSTGNILAQERSTHSKFGFKIGMNHTLMNFHRGFLPAGAVAVESNAMKSLTTGFLLNLPITGNVSIQPEYLYSSRKSYLPATGTTNHFQYLSLPVLMHITLTKKLSLHAGPQVDLLIHARKTEGKMVYNVTHDTEERNLSAVGGFQLAFTQKFFVEARYLHGISNVGIGQRSQVQEFKYGIAEFTAGIRF